MHGVSKHFKVEGKENKNYVGGETPPTSIKEKETHWPKVLCVSTD